MSPDRDATEEELFAELPAPLVLPPSEILATYETVNVLAPLVRCGKLPFRHLASLYETHITHTPMMLAPEFSRAQVARMSDFSTSTEERGVFWMQPRQTKWTRKGKGREEVSSSEDDLTCHPEDLRIFESTTYHHPPAHTRLPPSPTAPTKQSQLVRGALIAQFASPNPTSLADAAELISPYVDGLDLNCGCPQKWAYHEGIGCALLRKPELVRDMVRTVKDRMGWGWPVSIKIRVDPDLKWVLSSSSVLISRTNVPHPRTNISLYRRLLIHFPRQTHRTTSQHGAASQHLSSDHSRSNTPSILL